MDFRCSPDLKQRHGPAVPKLDDTEGEQVDPAQRQKRLRQFRKSFEVAREDTLLARIAADD